MTLNINELLKTGVIKKVFDCDNVYLVHTDEYRILAQCNNIDYEVVMIVNTEDPMLYFQGGNRADFLSEISNINIEKISYIRNQTNKIIGFIKEAPNGDMIARACSRYNKILGKYHKDQDITSHESGDMFGEGNHLTFLIHNHIS